MAKTTLQTEGVTRRKDNDAASAVAATPLVEPRTCPECKNSLWTTWTSTDVYWRTCNDCGFERIVDMSDREDWVEVQP